MASPRRPPQTPRRCEGGRVPRLATSPQKHWSTVASTCLIKHHHWIMHCSIGVKRVEHCLLVNDTKTGFLKLSAATGIVIDTDSIVGYGLTGLSGLKDVENAGNGFAFNVNVKCGYVDIDNLTLTASCTNACSGSGSCFNFGDIGMVRNNGTPPLPFAQWTPVSSALTSEGDLVVFPNPAHDEINISLQPGSTTSLKIWDQYGHVVWKSTTGNMDSSLSLKLDHRFPDGIYYLQGIADGKMSVRRFVVSK